MSRVRSRFESLISPVSAGRFFTRYWERRPLLSRGRDRERFAGLMRLEDMDALVHQVKHPHIAASIRLVKRAGAVLDHREVPWTERGYPDMRAVYEAYADGYTIVLNGIDQRCAAISELSRSLEQDLEHRIGVNAYFTPARSQGFLPHVDDHDVLILQLEGAKEWSVYRPVFTLPLPDNRPEIAGRELGRAVLKAELRGGDALYIPRGFVHEGRASGGPSLHLTVGLHAFTWADVMREAVASAARNDVALRRAVPSAVVSPVLRAKKFRRQFADCRRALLEAVSADEMMVGMKRRLINESVPDLSGHFRALSMRETITLDTPLVRRPGPPCEVSADRERASIRFSGNSVAGPALIGRALRFVARERTFSARDLPGPLTDQSKLVLARRLIKEGLLSAKESRSRRRK